MDRVIGLQRRNAKTFWMASAAAILTAAATPAIAQEAEVAPPPAATLPAAVEGAKSYTPADFARLGDEVRELCDL